jgi:hypothetical protein
MALCDHTDSVQRTEQPCFPGPFDEEQYHPEVPDS